MSMKEILRDPIYSEVENRLDRLGIDAILFDLDDTLIYTGEIFTRYMLQYCEVVGLQIGVSQEEMMKVLQEINDEEYKTMGVNPARWAAVVDKLALHFGHGEREVKENLDILLNIYQEVPRMRKGARVLLEIFKGTGRKICLVTHANVDWTIYKLDMLGLWNYLDGVVIVDENGHKKLVDWTGGAASVDTPAERCIVVGDSLGGDIRPGDEMGARTIHLPSPWSVYRQGAVPENTVIIDEIFEVLAALGRLR